MSERRQAHRREAIIVELVSGEVPEVQVHPLPWQERNDLGDEIIKQSQDITNEAIRVYVDQASGAPQLDMRLNEKLRDPGKIVDMAVPGFDHAKLTYPELYEIIYAALDVNDLEKLRPLLDPNSQTPTENGGSDSSGDLLSQIAGQKMPSSEDSSSEESTEVPSSPSPTENSSTS